MQLQNPKAQLLSSFVDFAVVGASIYQHLPDLQVHT